MFDQAEQGRIEDTDESFCAQEGLAALELPDGETEPSPVLVSRDLERAISAYTQAHECLRIAIDGYDEWYFEKSLQKMNGIRRLMQETNPLTGKAHSATSAEAVVETDATYRDYIERGSRLMLIRMHLEAGLAAAEARMTYVARRAGRIS